MATTPQEKARAAADALAARGQGVTARSVRTEAGVNMNVAAQVAAEWNATATSKESKIPEVPETVQARVKGIWSDAYSAATASFAATRAGLEQRAKAAEEERDALIGDVADLEASNAALTNERDQALAKVEELVARASKAETEASVWAAQLETARQRHDTALAAERETIAKLREEIAVLKAETKKTTK